MSLTGRFFGPLPPPELTPVQRAEKVRQLEANATSAHDLARFWADHDNPVAQAGEVAHMDEALDALLALGVGH
jgi:hypothetical protein